MFLILSKTWITFFNWPKFDEGCWNSKMILVKEVSILPSGSVYFAVRSKKNDKIVSAKLLPLMTTQTLPHLNVNVAVQFAQIFKIFARKMANFPSLGMRPQPHVVRLCSCVWDFCSRGERVAMWSSRCALKSLYCYTYYIGAVCLFFFWTQIRKNRCDSYKKCRSCVLPNISIVAISVGLPVAVNNPVPTSQVGFQQFHAFERLCVEGSNKCSDHGHSSNDLEYFTDRTFRASFLAFHKLIDAFHFFLTTMGEGASEVD